nr:immunoglobulin heavy chain junction region [Macaca mulatta]
CARWNHSNFDIW